MSLTVDIRCCVCDAPALEKPVEPTLSALGHGIMGGSALDALKLPDGWAVVGVRLPDPVLSEHGEKLADALENARVPAQSYGLLAAQVAIMSQPFVTELVVCPSCQDGAMWLVVKRRLKAATERQEEEREEAWKKGPLAGLASMPIPLRAIRPEHASRCAWPGPMGVPCSLPEAFHPDRTGLDDHDFVAPGVEDPE